MIGTLKEIDRHIPHKFSKPKDSLPWFTPKIKKMIKKRDRLPIKLKGFARALGVVEPSKITKRIKWLKKDILREMRQAYWSYVESIITAIGKESKKTPGLKRFWTFIKHCRSDIMGISLLMDETGNKVHLFAPHSAYYMRGHEQIPTTVSHKTSFLWSHIADGTGYCSHCMFHYITDKNMLHDLAGNSCQWYWPIVSSLWPSPFLEDWSHISLFPVTVTWAVSYDLL